MLDFLNALNSFAWGPVMTSLSAKIGTGNIFNEHQTSGDTHCVATLLPNGEVSFEIR